MKIYFFDLQKNFYQTIVLNIVVFEGFERLELRFKSFIFLYED